MTARDARWWENEATGGQGAQGRIASPAGRSGQIPCPKCGDFPVVYNGNYFCDNWAYPAEQGWCDWALAHPARSQRDREICDLIGIGYE